MSDEKLTEHEIEVLRMLAGEIQISWGAWVGACLEFLGEMGLATQGCPYSITDAGRSALSKARGETR